MTIIVGNSAPGSQIGLAGSIGTNFGILAPPAGLGISGTLKNGLLGYWKLDGNSQDSLGLSNGTDTNVTYSAGKINQGANFNGNGQIALGNTIPLDPFNWSMSIWFNLSSTNGRLFAYHGDGPTIWSYSGYQMAIVHSGGIDFYFGFTIPLNTWTHVVVTRSGTSSADNIWTAYRNGVQTAQSTIGAGGSSLFTSTQGVSLGSSTAPGFTEYITGTLDEAGIWNRALTQAEVITLYNASAGFSYPFGVFSDPVGIAQVNALAQGVVDSLGTDKLDRTQISGTYPTVYRNTDQIAQLRWYETNQSGISYATGNTTWGCCFDGSYVYAITDAGYKRVNISTGAFTNYATGVDYDNGCFDGRNVWLCSKSHNQIYKIDISTGNVTNAYTVTYPTDICFDGRYLWTSSFTGGNFISRIDPVTPTSITTYAVPSGTSGICFDGTYIWTNSVSLSALYRIRASDGAVSGSYSTTGNSWRICFDGTYVWVSPTWRIRVSDQITVSTINTEPVAWGMCFDGVNLWFSNYISNTVTKIGATDGALIGTYPVGTHPTTMCFDGIYVWAACSGTMSKL
jgi:hypothetical protein